MAVKYGRVLCNARAVFFGAEAALECVAWRPWRGAAALPVEFAATTWRVSLSRTPLLMNRYVAGRKNVFHCVPCPTPLSSVGSPKRRASTCALSAPGGHSCSPALPCSQPATYYASRRPCRGHLSRSSHGCHHLRLLLCRRRRRHRCPPKRHRRLLCCRGCSRLVAQPRRQCAATLRLPVPSPAHRPGTG